MESDDGSAVEQAFEQYLAGLGLEADALRRQAGRTLEQGARQARDLGWSQRRIARALRRSQPEVKRLLDRAGVETDHQAGADVATAVREVSMLDEVLRHRRDAIVDAAARYGVHHVRVFGSVAAAADGPSSDVDLLVDVDDDVGLFALGALEAELREILGRPVDVVPARSLRPVVREAVVAIPL